MFDIREGDYFILKVINRSHAKMKYKPSKKSDNSKRDEANSTSNENRKDVPAPYMPDYNIPFKLVDDDETPWGDDE